MKRKKSKLVLNQDKVRTSAADQLKTLSWAGMAALGFLTKDVHVALVWQVLAIVVWWFALQVVAHLILAIKDDTS